MTSENVRLPDLSSIEVGSKTGFADKEESRDLASAATKNFAVDEIPVNAWPAVAEKRYGEGFVIFKQYKTTSSTGKTMLVVMWKRAGYKDPNQLEAL